MQALTLVIGCGNPLCGDDGAGRIVVERLATELAKEPCRETTQCLSVVQWTPELAEPISQADCVYFVDAARGAEPGAIDSREVCVNENSLSPSQPAFSHHVQPERLLAIAASVYGRKPKAYLFTIVGRNFELGEALSPEVEAAVTALVTEMKKLLVASGEL
jgi:coenzyme F420 hydrogenase subunit delta